MDLRLILISCSIVCASRCAPLKEDVTLVPGNGANVTGKNADCMGGGYGGGYRRGGFGMGYGMGMGRLGGRFAGGGGAGGTMPMIIVINTGGGSAATSATTAASASLRRSARLKSRNQHKAAAKQLYDFLKSSS